MGSAPYRLELCPPGSSWFWPAAAGPEGVEPRGWESSLGRGGWGAGSGPRPRIDLDRPGGGSVYTARLESCCRSCSSVPLRLPPPSPPPAADIPVALAWAASRSPLSPLPACELPEDFPALVGALELEAEAPAILTRMCRLGQVGLFPPLTSGSVTEGPTIYRAPPLARHVAALKICIYR